METVENRQATRIHFSLIPPVFDAIAVLYPSDLIEVYVYSLTDVNGTSATVGMIEVTYTDVKKTILSSVVRMAI